MTQSFGMSLKKEVKKLPETEKRKGTGGEGCFYLPYFLGEGGKYKLEV